MLAAAALMLLNDLGLRAWTPGVLSGKLSDVGFLVVAPVMTATMLSLAGLPERWARAVGLGAVAGFYTVLQLWPPLGWWFSSAHVADAEDLLALPALLGAVWVWRRPAPRWASAVVGGPMCVVALVGTTPVVVPPAQSWPCVQDPDWEAGEPLRLQLLDHPAINDSFLRGMRLTDEAGEEVPLVAALLHWPEVAVCARHGLAANETFTWEIGPWGDSASSNELEFQHDALPTVTFTTGPEAGEPVADSASCAALVSSAPLQGSGCDGGWDSGQEPEPL